MTHPGRRDEQHDNIAFRIEVLSNACPAPIPKLTISLIYRSCSSPGVLRLEFHRDLLVRLIVRGSQNDPAPLRQYMKTWRRISGA
jgi:hypothetical protein